MAPTPGPVVVPLPKGPTDMLEESSYVITPRSKRGTKTKGLLNMPGQNNCFLNSAVQVLWHLDIFRRSFRQLSSHSCMEEACIFCALKELFTQFQYSQDSALPPDALRHALAKTFCDQRRFQLGFMDDAAECFENILWRIHVQIARNEQEEDMCGDLNCIPHQKFAMTLVEQPECHNCWAKSELLPFTQMVQYVTTSALCSKANEMHNCGIDVQKSFGMILKSASDVGEMKTCSGGCGSKILVKKTLMNQPEIVSIGLVWDSECPSIEHIRDVLRSIGTSLYLKDMFHAVCEREWADETYHELVGLVTYYGKHYSTFFFHTKLRIWIYFDDAVVREIGPSWDLVVEKCEKGRFQPLLLLFANPKGEWLPTSVLGFSLDSHVYIPSKTPSHHTSEKQRVIDKYLSLQHQGQLGGRNSRQSFNPLVNSDLPKSRYPNGLTSIPSCGKDAYKMMYNKPFSKVQNVPVYSNMQTLSAQANGPIYANTGKLDMKIPKGEVANHIYSNLHSNVNNEMCLPPIRTTQEQCPYKLKSRSDHSKDSDSAFTDDADASDTYISRKTVENVLNLQKQQKHFSFSYNGTIGNRNSSSSLESFDNMQSSKLNFIRNEMGNLLQRRDSGNWSGDRTSSSSSTSAETPFLSVVNSKRLMFGPSNEHPPGQERASTADTNMSDHGYDSYSVSSSDSYLSVTNSPSKVEPRLTQIPEDWSTQDFAADLDKKLEIVTSDDYGPPDCDRLCAEADLLLSKSHEKEKDGDLVMAALLSDSAAARARAAMEAPYNNSRSLVSAKMKHSTCVMRSSCLYRRLKDSEIEERRKVKVHHSRQSSRESTHSRHSRQNSRDGTNTKQSSQEIPQQFDEVDTIEKSIDIYGTLPKKGSRKKANSSSNVNKVKDDQIYRDFLEKQRKNITTCTSPVEFVQKNKAICHQDKTSTSTLEKQQKKSKDTNSLKKQTKSENPVSQTVEEFGLPGMPPVDSDCFYSEDGNCKDTVDRKQHRIKRKLMGSFMRRKNRSLPDLRADEELSDDFDRSMNSSTLNKSSVFNSAKERLKIAEQMPHDNVLKVAQQPHHAFIKKPITRKALLTKVSPPSINSIPSTTSKQIPMLPSIEKKFIDHLSESEKQSKIPFLTALLKSEAHLNQKPSLQPKLSSIPLATSQVHDGLRVKCKSPVSPPPVSTKVEDSLNPSNPFLAEIQAKRKQILGTDSSQSSKPPLPSQLPKMKPAPVKGTSLLRELQAKHQMMGMPKPPVQPRVDSLKQTTTANFNQAIVKGLGDPQSKVPLSVVPDGKEIGNINRVPAVNDKKTSTNVKNLASRFEKILPKEVTPMTCSAKAFPNSSDGTKTDLEKEQNLSCIGLKTETYDSTAAAQNAQNRTLDERDNGPSMSIETNTSAVSSRPQKPPDYETAIQRLELMRTNSNGVLKEGKLRASPPPPPPLTDPPRRKSSEKKKVTFSDEVVLVACAEFDDSGFFNNPLLERVYQKHIASGGREMPQFSGLRRCANELRRTEHSEDYLAPQTSDKKVPCNLCQKIFVEPTSVYCTDCSFYMSKFKN